MPASCSFKSLCLWLLHQECSQKKLSHPKTRRRNDHGILRKYTKFISNKCLVGCLSKCTKWSSLLFGWPFSSHYPEVKGSRNGTTVDSSTVHAQAKTTDFGSGVFLSSVAANLWYTYCVKTNQEARQSSACFSHKSGSLRDY